MQTLVPSALEKLLKPFSRCFTRETAKAWVKLRPDPTTRTRIEALGRKSTAGTLSPKERAEYESYVTAVDFIGILQSKARSFLRKVAKG